MRFCGGNEGGIEVPREDRAVAPRVLVVEDDDGVATVLTMCLSNAGFEVGQTATGKEALRILDIELPDAVVLDLDLPDQLGGTVLDTLRRAPPAAAPAWVVISALRQEEAARQYGSLGSFLAKPFDPWLLVEMLDGLLGRH